MRLVCNPVGWKSSSSYQATVTPLSRLLDALSKKRDIFVLESECTRQYLIFFPIKLIFATLYSITQIFSTRSSYSLL